NEVPGSVVAAAAVAQGKRGLCGAGTGHHNDWLQNQTGSCWGGEVVKAADRRPLQRAFRFISPDHRTDTTGSQLQDVAAVSLAYTFRLVSVAVYLLKSRETQEALKTRKLKTFTSDRLIPWCLWLFTSSSREKLLIGDDQFQNDPAGNIIATDDEKMSMSATHRILMIAGSSPVVVRHAVLIPAPWPLSAPSPVPDSIFCKTNLSRLGIAYGIANGHILQDSFCKTICRVGLAHGHILQDSFCKTICRVGFAHGHILQDSFCKTICRVGLAHGHILQDSFCKTICRVGLAYGHILQDSFCKTICRVGFAHGHILQDSFCKTICRVGEPRSVRTPTLSRRLRVSNVAVSCSRHVGYVQKPQKKTEAGQEVWSPRFVSITQLDVDKPEADAEPRGKKKRRGSSQSLPLHRPAIALPFVSAFAARYTANI
ncbi:hypothetical protein BaRGS_00023570, partial [Batillaria attramentaria]